MITTWLAEQMAFFISKDQMLTSSVYNDINKNMVYTMNNAH